MNAENQNTGAMGSTDATTGGTVVGFEQVPRVQQPMRRNGRIVYFHTQDNPFGNYEAMKLQLAGESREKILMRAYGVATKAMAGRFTKFNDRVHVIPDARVPKEGTNYQFIDPCSGRNWFMGWVRVDARGRRIIYREWPCARRYIEGVGWPGPWAVPSGKKADGEPGDAQKSFGFGLKRYRDEILRMEGHKPTGATHTTRGGDVLTSFEKTAETEKIEERWMDSRFANAKILSAREEPLTLIEEMERLEMEFLETAPQKGLIDDGVDLVNDLLDYDVTRPIGADNEPMLYIAESCENIIYALHEWTGKDGQKGATKDPIDIVRWVAGTELDFMEGNKPKFGRVRSY
jgi:hypothetical protein